MIFSQNWKAENPAEDFFFFFFASQRLGFGLCCDAWFCPEVVSSFSLHIQQLFLFSQLPHLPCKLSRQGAAIFPSVLIMLLLIHPFSFTSLFPKWPHTPATTLFTKLTGSPTVIGPSSGKSTLTSLINWMPWPLRSVWKRQWSYGVVLFVSASVHILKSAGNDFISEEAFHSLSYVFIIAERMSNSHLFGLHDKSWKIEWDEKPGMVHTLLKSERQLNSSNFE